MGFSTKELEAFRGATVPDLLGEDCRLLFVGINPGLWTAATQTHFCHPSNRFYPALRRAGVIEWEVDRGSGMTDAQRADFVRRGLGITNLVARATARASEISAEEIVSGGVRLREMASRLNPRVVAVAGVTAYRIAFESRGAVLGLQPDAPVDFELWAVPNPSGLNAHETVQSLADWYRRAAVAAGVVDDD